MRKLIAVMTCQQKRLWADAQRETWVRDIVGSGQADVRFFYGGTKNKDLKRDEVWLDVPDDYRGIPLKVRAICDYAREHNYDYVAKCDDDVYIVPERFPALPLYGDYIGRFRSAYGDVYPPCFASGFFYWLSNRAMNIVADTPWNGDWMDERFVATALARRGIIGHHDVVNYMATGPHLPAAMLLSSDSFRKATVFCEYGPRDMRGMHEAMRHLKPVPLHPGLERQPDVVVTDAILSSKPNDDVPWHKRNRVYAGN